MTNWLPHFVLLILISFFPHTYSFATEFQHINLSGTQTIRPETTSGLQAFYKALDYRWKALEEGVPPFILESIPTDISSALNTASKKHSFFMGLLPMVLLANQEIEEERNHLQQLLSRQMAKSPQDGDEERINEISRRYGLRGHPLTDHRVRSRLLRRVDTIPPALVLAQAANESAWGTSRFAQLGNNLFGEWTYTPGAGIIPEDRPPGASYEVRKFPSLYESIRSYMNNLNRNEAYLKLRETRESLRKEGKLVTGTSLAYGLSKYSQRGAEYISEIQVMIRQNQLARTNRAFLRKPKAEGITNTGDSGGGLFSTRNRLTGQHKELKNFLY
jgi:Bax protein